MSVHIKTQFGVEDLYFYKLVKVSNEEDLSLNVCSTKDFSGEIGATKELKNGTWRHDQIHEDELEYILSDLADGHGNIFFADVKKYYKSLDHLLKDHYTIFSINSAIISTKKPEVKYD